MNIRKNDISIHPLGYAPWTMGVKQKNKFSSGVNSGGINARHQNLKTMKTIKKTIGTALTVLMLSTGAFAQATGAYAQTKATVGILNIDSKGVLQDPEMMGYMVRLEVEKIKVYNVMDKYDMADIVEKSGIDVKNCYGKSCLVAAGRKLNVDKMLTGSVNRFGEKIVIDLKLIDVKTEMVEQSDLTEYLNLQPEIQKMIGISVKKLFGIDNDENLVNLLVDYESPVSSPKTTLRLDGPRMGASLVTGDAGERIQASEDEGGYDMFPVTSQFGYQFEKQYLSAGNFQALVEFIFNISGLESGRFIPSLVFMNGFRGGKSGWEFAFGPVFEIVKLEKGFYGDDKKWYRKKDWNNYAIDNGFTDTSGTVLPNHFKITESLDSRGVPKFSTRLVLAAGKTFKSGYLNIPFNVYIIPDKKGTVVGVSFGFNINKKPKIQ